MERKGLCTLRPDKYLDIHGPVKYGFETIGITPRMVCNWIQHLAEKDWVTAEILGEVAFVLAKRTGRTQDIYSKEAVAENARSLREYLES